MGEQFKLRPSGEFVGQVLRQAVYTEDTVTLEHLLKTKADLNAQDETGATPLHIATMQDKPDTVAWLLKGRANIESRDKEGFSALTWSCIKGHVGVMKVLLNGRADVNEIVESREDQGKTDIDKESCGKTPLALSAEKGQLDCVQELLARRCNVDALNRNGSTALMCAASHSETRVVAQLLERQAMVNQVDSEGWTPLMYSVNAPMPKASQVSSDAVEMKINVDGVMGKRSSTEILLLHGADANAQTADGLTPLIIACTRDWPTSVKVLLQAKANVNEATAKGQTALIMAAALNFPLIVRALIAADANVNAANAKKDTPLSLAEKGNFTEVKAMLSKAGATMPKDAKKAKKGKKK